MNKVMATMALAGMTASAQSAGPSQFQAKTTMVMAMLKPKTPVDREAIMKVMPEEVRDTLQLYLDGKITQWFGRADGMGVVSLLDCKSVEEARVTMDALPLIKQNLATFEYVALSPLTPLRMLLAPQKP